MTQYYSLCDCAFCDWIIISCETEWWAHSRVERMGGYQSYFTISHRFMTWTTNNSINCYHPSDLSVKTPSRWKTCPMQLPNGLNCWYVKQISSLAGAKDSHRFSSHEQINIARLNNHNYSMNIKFVSKQMDCKVKCGEVKKKKKKEKAFYIY